MKLLIVEDEPAIADVIPMLDNLATYLIAAA